MNGLVLEGGGVRGAYQVGVFKALQEKNIEFGVVTGTSIGALNGALIAMKRFDQLLELYEKISPGLMFEADPEVIDLLSKETFDKTNIFSIISVVNKVLTNKGLDITPLKKLVDEYIDEETLRNSGIRFGVVAIDLEKKKPLEIYLDDMEKGSLNDYLIASASLPIFKSEEARRKFLDGGFYDNLPIRMLVRENDVDTVYVIRLRSYGVVRDYSMYDHLVIFEPSEDLGGILNINNELINKNIKMGYYDAIRKLEGHDGFKYTIRKKDENYYLNMFSSISDESIKALSNLLLIDEKKASKRLLFENIIPTISKLLKLKETSGYKEIFITLTEKIASLHHVDKYKVYDIDELLTILGRVKLSKDYVKTDSWEMIKVGAIMLLKTIDNEEADKLFEAIFSMIMEG